MAVTTHLLPKPLSQLALTDPNLQETELNYLKRLADAGLEVAPLLVVPAGLEEYFYRLNTLPAQLSTIFAKVKPKNPDEDEVEDAVPQGLGHDPSCRITLCPWTSTPSRKPYAIATSTPGFFATIITAIRSPIASSDCPMA